MWDETMWSDIEIDLKKRNSLNYNIISEFSDMFDPEDFQYHYSSRYGGIVLDKFVNNRYTDVLDLVIPSEIGGKPVKVIGEYCFFRSRYIERIAIPSSITEIQRAAFFNCPNLYRIIFEGSSIAIGESAFSGTAIEAIAIPEGLSYLPINTFYDCQKIKEIFLPNSLVHIGNAFDYCTSLRRLFIPGSINRIEALPSSVNYYDIISPISYSIQQAFPWYSRARFISAEEYWFTLDFDEDSSGDSDNPSSPPVEGEFDTSSWSTESILMAHGYTVSQRVGLSDKARQEILLKVLNNHLATKREVIGHIELQINLRKANSIYSLAIEKWKRDIEFIKAL